MQKARIGLRPLLELLIVFALFALHGAWPVPDVNEPHYLTKAHHTWDNQWLAGDLFLEAPPAHRVFNFTFGWLSLLTSLETFAWCGRLATWLLQAWGWTVLSRSLTRRGWAAPVSAGLFVLFNERAHLAGEWVVGGLEAKGVAYALVFLAIAALVRRRWGRTWLLAGGAAAFHVLVGGWTAVAAALTWLTVDRRPVGLKRMVLPLALGAALGLCGLVPALMLNWGADEADVRAARIIYVFERLPHHLVPGSFPTEHVVRFLILVTAWMAIVLLTPSGPRRRRLRVAVGAALAIAAVGTTIGLATSHDRELAASLLRFYWFRLADVFVPMGLALEIIAVAASQRKSHPGAVRWIVLSLALFVSVHLAALMVERSRSDRPRADRADRIANYADWRQACGWINDNTPRDARFLTPRLAQTFKWYAQRSEVVTWKDIPQDAENIARWRRRLEEIHATRDPQAPSRWYGSLAELGSERLVLLAQKYDADYVLTVAAPRLALRPIFQNNSYAIYRIEPEGVSSRHE